MNTVESSRVLIAAAAALSMPVLAADKVSVIEHVVREETVDLGKKGDSIGDILVFSNPLFDADNKTSVGHDQGFCVRVVVGTSYECTWTIFLKEGQISAQGPVNDMADSVMAIVGGTGKYLGARGAVAIHARDGHSYDFKYEIL